MKKQIAFALTIIAAFTAASAVHATTTWSEPTTLPGYVRASKAACTSGTETSHTATGAGFDLAGLKGFVVMAKTAGGNMTAGGKLQAWLKNPVTNTWARAAELDITVTAVAEEAYPGYTVTMPYGVIAFDPNGVNTALDIYILGR